MSYTFLLGVDAGGTKTLAAAYTPDGTKIAQASGTAGNVTTNFNAAAAAITDTVAALISCLERNYSIDGDERNCANSQREACLQHKRPSIGDPSPLSLPLLCVGAAGASTMGKALQNTLTQAFGERIGKICVVSDAELALLAAHGGKDGVLIISGTGSIGYRKAGDALLRCGGWGHLLGDEGSGYDIAVSAIRAVLKASETGDYHADTLRDALLSRLSLSSLPQLVSYVYSHQKSDVAALAETVARTADNGDALAQDILQRAGEMLGAIALTLLQRQPTDVPLPVAVSGSVMTQSPRVRAAFERSLCAAKAPVSRVFAVEEPTLGVVAMHQNRL